MFDGVSLVGHVVITLTDIEKNSTVTAYDDHNLVVLGTRSAIARFLTGESLKPPSAIAVGTGTASATSLSASGLQFEIARSAFSVNSLIGGYTARYVANFGTNQGNGLIRELGLFGPNYMWAIVSASANKTSKNTMSITWELATVTGSAL